MESQQPFQYKAGDEHLDQEYSTKTGSSYIIFLADKGPSKKLTWMNADKKSYLLKH